MTKPTLALIGLNPTTLVPILFSILLFGHSTLANADELQPALVVIIDDLGNNWQQDQQALMLPGPVTLAILPHTPFGPRLANLAHANNKEVMLHAPMENHAGLALGTGGLDSYMDEATFKKILHDDIASIPYVEGINNHTGSALTELKQPMRWTMDVVKELGLYFIDSRTSAKSLAHSEARHQHIASQSRDVFLDNEPSPEALERQFQQAIQIAQENGAAILIGHTYPTSTAFLHKVLPTLDEMGIRLVSASALLYDIQGAER